MVLVGFYKRIWFCLVELGDLTIISDMIDHVIETQDTTYLYSRLELWLISVIGVSGVCATWLLLLKISTNITRDIRDVFEHAQHILGC